MNRKILVSLIAFSILATPVAAELPGNGVKSMAQQQNQAPSHDMEPQNLEEAKQRINRLESLVTQLRERVQELERERGRERNRTNATEDGENNSTRGPQNRTDGGPAEPARENINGTPGSENAQENRPGFVNRLLRGLFG